MEPEFDFEAAKVFIDSFKELAEKQFDEHDLPNGLDLVKKYYKAVDNMAKCMILIEEIDLTKTKEGVEANMRKALKGYIRNEAFYRGRMNELIDIYK